MSLSAKRLFQNAALFVCGTAMALTASTSTAYAAKTKIKPPSGPFAHHNLTITLGKTPLGSLDEPRNASYSVTDPKTGKEVWSAQVNCDPQWETKDVIITKIMTGQNNAYRGAKSFAVHQYDNGVIRTEESCFDAAGRASTEHPKNAQDKLLLNSGVCSADGYPTTDFRVILSDMPKYVPANFWSDKGTYPHPAKDKGNKYGLPNTFSF